MNPDFMLPSNPDQGSVNCESYLNYFNMRSRGRRSGHKSIPERHMRRKVYRRLNRHSEYMEAAEFGAAHNPMTGQYNGLAARGLVATLTADRGRDVRRPRGLGKKKPPMVVRFRTKYRPKSQGLARRKGKRLAKRPFYKLM